MKQLNKLFSAKSAKMLLLSFLLALLPTAVNAQCPNNNHPHMIDLGLPSGTKWACCNVGAEKPEDYGGYYAWGETEVKDSYSWETYIHCDGTQETRHDIGDNIAGTQYDAATVNWGSPWVMPSQEQLDELINNTTSEWVNEYGVNGRRFTGTNGASIFLPAAGYLYYDFLNFGNQHGWYWLSTFHEENNVLYNFNFASGWAGKGGTGAYAGQSVRPVVASSSTSSAIAIDETNFPDVSFRNWVLAQDYGQDGVLTEDEIAGVTSIDVAGNDIANLKGIEYFSALTNLACFLNQLTSLDVSKNTALTLLDCGSNQLTSLDVSKNTALTTLDCGYNQLTALDVSQNTALTYLDCFGNQLTSLDISQNTALGALKCIGNQLTSLDVSKNTALTTLNCSYNQLASLNVSKNTALMELVCYGNQLTSLDVSKNTALTTLDCGYNQLTSLDVSQNTALTYLDCYGNQLTSLDISQNTILTRLNCSINQLTSLDVSKNTALTELRCYSNQILETEMGNLVESLPANNGELYVKDLSNANEQNVITTTQVAVAKAKLWKVYAWDENWNRVEYDGEEPQDMSPVEQGESIDIGNEIDSNTNLDGNVVGDVFYSISSGDGSYNAAEGCIVVTKPTDESAIEGKDIFGEDFKAGFTGIVFKVAPGEGTVKVEAQTQGNMVLKVKIGDNDPIEMELEGKLKVPFPYNVSEETLVYIYGSIGAAGAKGIRKAAGSDALKIYGIEVTSETNGIDNVQSSMFNVQSPIYNLNGQRVISSPSGRPGGVPTKGIYIQNGRKVLVK